MFNELNVINGAKSMYQRVDNDAQLRAHASRLFERIVRKGSGGLNLFGRSRKARALVSLAELQGRFTRQHYIGIQTVPVEKIVGSENRTTEFDGNFTPQADHLESRWVNVAMATLKEVSLPPVDLIQVGKCYFVRDGHHRISVARAFDQATISATVTVWE
jgi:hypothetical protein